MNNFLDKDCPKRVCFLRHCNNLFKKNKSFLSFANNIKIADTAYELVQPFGNAGNMHKILNDFIFNDVIERKDDGIYFNQKIAKDFLKDTIYMKVANEFKILEKDFLA